MKQIYASACHIVIWLGPESDDSDLAMTAIQYFSRQSKEPDPLRDVYHRFQFSVEFSLGSVWRFAWHHSYTKGLMRTAALQPFIIFWLGLTGVGYGFYKKSR